MDKNKQESYTLIDVMSSQLDNIKENIKRFKNADVKTINQEDFRNTMLFIESELNKFRENYIKVEKLSKEIQE